MKNLDDLVQGLRAQLAQARGVARVGLLGMALGGGCVAIGLVRGFDVPPEGNLWETAVFNGALGFFLLTLAALAGSAGFTTKGHRRWSVTLVPAALFAYGVETVQAFRGLDPRFSAVAGPPDQILGGVFLIDALLIMVLFYVLAARFFRSDPTPLSLAVRYAAAASAVSFGVGIWMSFFGGRAIAPTGNLMPIHAAGFHGVQAIPLIALFLVWGGVADAGRWVHLAGLSWLGFCFAVLWQAVAGWAPTDLSPALVWALACLVAWSVAAVVALRAWAAPATT